MATVNEIFDYFEEKVPTSMKMDFDNPGFLAGDGERTVTKVLLALDITMPVIAEAAEWGAELILSHHPMFFETKNVSTRNLTGKKVVALLGGGMSAICLHTNLDSVSGGVNDALMAALGARTEGILEPSGTAPDGKAYGLGRFGAVEEMPLEQFLPRCKAALHANGLRYVSGGRSVHRIAVCGGSGGSMLLDAAGHGCDTLVTGDVKHNQFLDAAELGINLIDAGHFPTENVVIPVLEQMVQEAFPDVGTRISRVQTQPEQFYI